MTGVIYTVYARGNPKKIATEQKRGLAWSPYQFVPFYVRKGQVVNVVVSGETEGNVFSVIGLPNDRENMSTYSLVKGDNVFSAKSDGVLSFKNHNENNDVFIEVRSSHQQIPNFELHNNSNKDWDTEMAKYSDSPWVILSTNLSDIIVTYSTAKKYIKDADKLMENNERIIHIEDRVSGFIENGKADYKLDNNRALHLESFDGFMYATDEYTGYNEGQGAMNELLGLGDRRWGVWHENGHQRQQFPWQWMAGTGLTEVTTNIYSLFVEEEITGRASVFDNYYREMQSFLSKSDKSYDDQSLLVKLGLFWQLKLAFGEQFYPQLHQRYRLMRNTPPTNDSHQQKQLFIVTVSNLVGINLEPFFSKWGIYSDLNTLAQLSFLPDLTQPIWEYNNDNHHLLPMPESKYIPELIYFKSSIKNVELKEDHISFVIDKDWYSPYQYYFKLNGNYLAEVNNGGGYYCFGTLTSEGFKVDIRSSGACSGFSLKDSDIFSVETNFDGLHISYYSSILLNNLWDDILKLFTDDSFTSLAPDTNQSTLDALWLRYNESKNDHTIKIRDKLLLAQKLFLYGTIKNDRRSEDLYFVEFSDESFKDYTYLASSCGELIGELRNGQPLLSGTIDGRTWKIPSHTCRYDQIDIIAIAYGKEFLIRRVFWEDFLLSDRIEALSDKDDLNQKDIDDLKNDILSSNLPYWTKLSLISKLDELQRSFLLSTIYNVTRTNLKIDVTFNDNTLFRNYRYMLMCNSGYVSEVSYGKPYYSSINGVTWTTTVTQEQLDSLYIEVYVDNSRYKIYEFSTQTENIIYDYP